MKNEIKKGDIFLLGKHKLINGDCTNPETVRKLFENEKASCIVADPPYGAVAVEAGQGFSKMKNHKPIINDHLQSDAEYEKFTQDWLDASKPFLESKNSIYIFNSDKMIFALRNAMVRSGLHFAQLLVWVKTHAVVGRLDYLPQHELLAYGWLGTHKFHRPKDKSVLVFPKPNKNTLHPTLKPLGLLRKIILNSSRTNEIIYDPFGGVASTLLACEQTARRCFMIELDPEYCLKAIERYEKATGNKAVKIN